jgi:DNA-directed RNA polymerase subunit RPC12/RpoP
MNKIENEKLYVCLRCKRAFTIDGLDALGAAMACCPDCGLDFKHLIEVDQQPDLQSPAEVRLSEDEAYLAMNALSFMHRFTENTKLARRTWELWQRLQHDVLAKSQLSQPASNTAGKCGMCKGHIPDGNSCVRCPRLTDKTKTRPSTCPCSAEADICGVCDGMQQGHLCRACDNNTDCDWMGTPMAGNCHKWKACNGTGEKGGVK